MRVIFMICFLAPIFCFSQYGDGGAIITDYGYHDSGKRDTVKCEIVVQDLQCKCFKPVLEVISGYAVRKIMVYSGDRMPPQTYDDGFEILLYLNANKKALDKKKYKVWIAN